MKSFTNVTLALSVSLILAACGSQDTTSSNSSNLVPDEPVANTAPNISGTPSSSVDEGASYQFSPVVYDVDGDPLSFSIENLPAWATFNSDNGNLSGTPGTDDAGEYGNISITVSDGDLTASLPSFTITVNDVTDTTPPPGNDLLMGAPTLTSATISGSSVVLSWSQGSYAIPEGGYDIFIDGIDTGPQYRTTSTFTTIPNLDLTEIHCFNVESRYTDTSDFFASSQLCTVTQEGPNQSPIISGSPATSIIAGATYSFTPSANDPDGDSLTFSIQNVPSWASFDSNSGTLSGNPQESDVGSYNDISISVSDGTVVVSLTAFNITISSSTVETGSFTLNWIAPSTRSDGTSMDLSEIDGYRVYVGDRSDALQMELDLNDGGATSTTISNKPLGSYFVAITAYDTDGNSSSLSNVIEVSVTN